MPNVINVAILVDAENLIEKLNDGTLSPGTENDPTFIGNREVSDKYIYMVAKNALVVNGQAKSSLTITAQTGDTIKWNMMTFGQNADYSAFVYKSDFSLSKGTGHIGIKHVGYENQVIGVRIPEDDDPTGELGKFKNTVYTTSADVSNVDQTIVYNMTFQLVDERNGEVRGYFYWDPHIEIPF